MNNDKQRSIDSLYLAACAVSITASGIGAFVLSLAMAYRIVYGFNDF